MSIHRFYVSQWPCGLIRNYFQAGFQQEELYFSYLSFRAIKHYKQVDKINLSIKKSLKMAFKR